MYPDAMLEGVERLIDLTGARASALTGASLDQAAAAVRAADVAALAATDGHVAAVARDGVTVRLARTIALPLRYFVAKMYHGPFLVVSDRMDRIFDWCQAQRIGWQFDPAYTRMVPAHYLVEVDQVGCPDPAPRYHRFFEPSIGQGSDDLTEAGAAYVSATYAAVRGWIGSLPAEADIAVAFSGGVDSTAILLLARRALEDLGRGAGRLRAFTLDLGDGRDAAQAEGIARAFGFADQWERVAVPEADYDLAQAIGVIEDYHPLDVECAAAALCLLRGIRERYPSLTYLLDGDGGDENLKSYPLEDSDLTISSVLKNPLLYHEGWGIDAIKHSLAYSGGLSRGYVRTSAPAHAYGFEACSPFTMRSVIASALAIPFDQVLQGDEARLGTLKQEVVHAGLKQFAGIDMPVNPKRRFQDGAGASPRTRVSKGWCRQTFNAIWQERLRHATDNLDTRRSGNEMVLNGVGGHFSRTGSH
ncbi:MAG TPA: asparagine synthase-related protein [Vicinamibacterales bacterium]|nr:asparagine synthase-related protein [Vicinamibacterales bacterium]